MEPSWWIILMATVMAMIVSFMAYFCGCCKKLTRDELIGLSGIVKISNPDSFHNHNGPIAISITRTPSEDNVPLSSIPSSNASAKRLDGTNQNVSNTGTATRSLPDLPVDAVDSAVSDPSQVIANNFATYNSGDANSDLYATLEENTTNAGTRTKLLQNNVVTTYEQIDEGVIYNKIIREHPYAQVDENMNASSSRHEDNPLDGRLLGPTEEPAPIPAASAIAGGVAASHELPYMTPPILPDHFVEDSHDSAKGYTSITVREPLCHIRPQNPVNQDTTDSHYTVLSDDSDEMYAAIQEAYTSGSETYAQIQPVVPTSTYEVLPETIENSSQQRFSVAMVHSRQASTSSIASSMTARNSPKEKRQANSPLPKPPDVSPDDMYAKVLKKRKGENDYCNSRDSVYSAGELETVSSLTIQSSNATDQKTSKQDYGLYESSEKDDPDRYACGYEILPERNYEQLSGENISVGYETLKGADSNPGYESLPEPDSLTPGYERIREPVKYEKLKYGSKEDESDPNYEELKPQCSNETFHCYATIDKSSKIKLSRSETEPDYASLTRHNDSECSDSFYERINRNNSADNGGTENCNDSNNNHSNESMKNELPRNGHSTSMTNLSDLYSKVQKTVKR